MSSEQQPTQESLPLKRPRSTKTWPLRWPSKCTSLDIQTLDYSTTTEWFQEHPNSSLWAIRSLSSWWSWQSRTNSFCLSGIKLPSKITGTWADHLLTCGIDIMLSLQTTCILSNLKFTKTTTSSWELITMNMKSHNKKKSKKDTTKLLTKDRQLLTKLKAKDSQLMTRQTSTCKSWVSGERKQTSRLTQETRLERSTITLKSGDPLEQQRNEMLKYLNVYFNGLLSNDGVSLVRSHKVKSLILHDLMSLLHLILVHHELIPLRCF